MGQLEGASAPECALAFLFDLQSLQRDESQGVADRSAVSLQLSALAHHVATLESWRVGLTDQQCILALKQHWSAFLKKTKLKGAPTHL